MKKLMFTGIALLALMAPLAANARPVRVLVAPGYAWRPGYAWGPGYTWGWYSPYWGANPYGYGYYNYGPTTGAVKFDTKVKDAEVYVNGAYAGKLGKLKTMNLRPGSYDIEIRAAGRTQFEEKVYVTAGKTVHLNPDLHVQVQPTS